MNIAIWNGHKISSLGLAFHIQFMPSSRGEIIISGWSYIISWDLRNMWKFFKGKADTTYFVPISYDFNHLPSMLFCFFVIFIHVPLVSRKNMLSPRNNDYSPGGWVEFNCKAKIKLLILCPFYIAIFIFLLFNFTH